MIRDLCNPSYDDLSDLGPKEVANLDENVDDKRKRS